MEGAASPNGLALVGTSLAAAGPRVCLASIDDYRQGRLTGEWVSLRRDAALVRAVVRSVLDRTVTSVSLGVGVFDVEGASLNDTAVRELLSPVLGVEGRRRLNA